MSKDKKTRQREAQARYRERVSQTKEYKETRAKQERDRRERVRNDPKLAEKEHQRRHDEWLAQLERRRADPELAEKEIARSRQWARENYLYGIWLAMVYRCHNPKHKAYPSYGGRGITVYGPWREDFPAFKAWILENLGPRPEGTYPSGRARYSLDRKDNDGNYGPDNLQWATQSQQTINQRTVAKLEAKLAALQAELDRARSE